MAEVSFLRQAGWFSPEDAQDTIINIVGVGATGSNIGLIAAKMGFHKFRVWDADIVESHNLPNQTYDVAHVGQLKVNAFKDVLTRFNPRIEVETNPVFFETALHKENLEGILVLTVDTMSARKDIFDSFNMNWNIKQVFETRLGFDYGELNVLDPLDPSTLKEWNDGLLNDDDIPEGPCNLRICTTLVSMVSAYTVHAMCGIMHGEKMGDTFGVGKKTIFNVSNGITTYELMKKEKETCEMSL
jgi:hypothetical protein